VAERAEHVNRLLRLAVGRAEEDPFFVGFALRIYRAAEELDDAGLAERLGCAPADLPSLALCRRPTPTATSYRHDVDRIAVWAHTDADRLANVLRFAEGVEAMRRMRRPAGADGVLMAARDAAAETAPEDETDATAGRGGRDGDNRDEEARDA
jgi:hypothetical protein